MLACALIGGRVQAAPVEVTDFGSNPGNLRMFLYLPAALPTSSPLVVALHGCGQAATDYDNETGWMQYADQLGFALLLPEQKSGWFFGNHPLGCFNWYYRGDQTRGRGEALSIKQMIDRAVADHQLDPDRVYVTGLSAGGAMTAVMLATYPETFAGGAIIAGVPYGCSAVPAYLPQWLVPYLGYLYGYTNPLYCMTPGINRTPAQWGDRVRAASGTAPAHWPRISIWQGTADVTVAPRNAIELVEQWTNVHGSDAVADVDQKVNGHIHRIYHGADGEAAVELYFVAGAGHGTPVDPPARGATGTTDRCGVAAPYVVPAGICSSYYVARFWGLTPSP